jgi:hypothetical protein
LKIIFIASLLASCFIATASDYCSLKIRVLTPDGKRVEASVYVTETDGRVHEAEQEERDVEFCDLGLLPVTVSIGEEKSCGQVVIKNVRLTLNHTRLLTVTYDVNPCRSETVPSPTPNCLILFRVADSSGKWISGAAIHLDSLSAPAVTDSAGRASVRINMREKASGSAVAAGYRPASFMLSCTPETTAQEKNIRLNRP